MRHLTIGVLAFSGGFCLSQGAARGWWQLTVIGLILLCLGMAVVISGHAATTVMRTHTRAIIRASWLYYLFKRIL